MVHGVTSCTRTHNGAQGHIMVHEVTQCCTRTHNGAQGHMRCTRTRNGAWGHKVHEDT